jgi:monothiol glutaredoxin
MEVDTQTRSRIESIIGDNRVVLFMKGTPAQPQCGFSARTIGVLNQMVDDYETVNVLADQEMREGIKAFSDWPTVPQLYVDGEFQGGCDLVMEMYNRGDLHTLFGKEPPDRTPPEINISVEAAAMMRGALEANPGASIHLTIDDAWEHQFNLGPASGHEVRASSNGIDILMDVNTAPRTKGMSLSVTDNVGGQSLSVDNPNMPPPVRSLDVSEFAEWRKQGTAPLLVDVRTPAEREQASIGDSTLLDAESMPRIEAMDREIPIVFYCHTGMRSAQAAEHFRKMGFTTVYNLTGGIDAWSRQIDSSVPVY